MILQIEFEGLCLVAVDRGKLEPKENDVVTVLLPDNAPMQTHQDGTTAIDHHPHLLIAKTNVPDPGNFEVITSTGQNIDYVVVPLRKMDVAFEPAPAQPTARPAGGDTRPDGDDTTIGLGRLIDFDWFTDGLQLNRMVEPLHRESVVQPGSPATRLVATRIRLRNGVFSTINARDYEYRWSFENTLSRTEKYPRQSGVAQQLFFTAELPESFRLVLKPFDGSDPTTLEVVANRGDVVRLQIGNECLDPKDWDNPQARCNENEEPGPVVRDTDFKAHYTLLESSDGQSLEQRLDSRELPVPTITRLDKAMAGSEWCERALIQVG